MSRGPSSADSKPRRKRRPRSTLSEYFSSTPSTLTLALLVFPVFAIYQIGVVFMPIANGVDLVTHGMIALAQSSMLTYLGLNMAMVAAFGVVVARGRKAGGFDPGVFTPLLLESGAYALLMGSLIVFVMRDLLGLGRLLSVPALALPIEQLGVLERVVVSCGAGFHEELIFRLFIFGGLAWALRRGVRLGRVSAILAAAVVSAVLFSAVHHLGPLGEPLRAGPFVYRFLSGLFFVALFKLRNFAVAVYTHTLYDVYVLVLG